MHRRFSGFLLAALLLNGIGSAQAQTAENYRPVSLADLTRLTVDLQAVDLKDATAFSEYLKIMDCRRYNDVKDSQFKQQELQHAVLAHQAQTKLADRASDLYVSIPTTFVTSGYNFDTQSMDIMPQNRLRRVNTLQLYDSEADLCEESPYYFRKIPTAYQLQLNAPVSLHRIPLQRNLAENLTTRLDISRSRADQRIIYANIQVQIEGVQPKVAATVQGQATGTVHGQVTAIDLYIDHERKIRFKRLNYLEAF